VNKRQAERAGQLLEKIKDAEAVMKKPSILSFWLKRQYGLISNEAPLDMRVKWGMELDRDCVEQILTLQVGKWNRELKELGCAD